MGKVIAFDLGSSGGRAMLGSFERNKLSLLEIHRFKNEPVSLNGRVYWDVLRLFFEIKTGLLKCIRMGHGDIQSIGINTWGVDYGLINKDGHLIENPRNYRDKRTNGMAGKSILPPLEMYLSTGIYPMDINTVYQLSSEPVPDSADKLLLMPDLMGYFLTGKKRAEKTILSTSQAFDIQKNELAYDVLDKCRIDKNLFCEISEPGSCLGVLLKEIADETGLPQIPVVSVAGHDTACAVAAIPFEAEKASAFISCGSWSLLGAELPKPVITKESFEAGFTNEAGYNGTTRFLRNITGLWITQQCRAKWMRDGENVTYEDLNKETAAAKTDAYIDPDDPMFASPSDMPAAIKAYCEKTNQTPPVTRGEILACVLQSMTRAYKTGIENLGNILDKKIDVIHMMGGGIQNELLCRQTAEVTGKTVVAGPVEATAAGNAIIQFIANKEIEDIKKGREIIKNSFEFKIYP